MIEDGRIGGIVTKQQYVPTVYSHTRKSWIEAFFTQNHFIGMCVRVHFRILCE